MLKRWSVYYNTDPYLLGTRSELTNTRQALKTLDHEAVVYYFCSEIVLVIAPKVGWSQNNLRTL